ncbi:violet-sensitive opsin-like [Pecten maximus]|uniref:violet-sensitive opsin-like n=1 Tax=Pecten maximus TaxID=6579 RepID=UPI00145878A0|nr:violet-sensitive opsin-like [Pecten maximus]
MNWNDTCFHGEHPRDIYCYPDSPVCVTPALVGLQILFLVCVMILSVTSCTLLIYVVHRTRSMSISMKTCIISLSTAYILSSVYPIPILCYSIIYSHLVIADAVCRSSPLVVMVTSISTNWTLALVGLDRFLTIFRPFTYPITMNLRKSVAMVVSAWLIGVVFATQPCFGWRDVGICFQPRALQICGITWNTSKVFSYVTWSLTVAAPFCLLVFCYSKIALLAKSLIDPERGENVIRIPRTCSNNVRPERRLVRRRSVTACLKTFKIVIINIGTICLCWVPYSVLSVMSLDANRAGITYSQDFIGYCLLFLPNFVNPIVFIGFNKDYRDSVTRLWNRMWGTVRNTSGVSAYERSRRTLDSTQYDYTTTTANVRVRTVRQVSIRHM